MKVSVIIPTFNQARYVKKSIDSVLSQSYKNIECIVIDGGSTDDTIKILKSYADKIIWKSEKDKGISDAVNKGFRKATGEVITFIGGDDYYVKGAIAEVVKRFKDSSDVEWITGDYIITNENGKRIKPFVSKYKKILRNLPFKKTSLLVANYIIQPATFFKASVVKRNGAFKTNLKYCMDYDYWLRLNSICSLQVINKPLIYYRIHPSSNRGSQYKELFKEDMKVVRHYTNNPFILVLHFIHNYLVTMVYNVIG
jgi:glycosyltransferase involved in cell wall biosynthesis